MKMVMVIVALLLALAVTAHAEEWQGECGKVDSRQPVADMTHFGIWRSCLVSTRKAKNNNELARACLLQCLPKIGEAQPDVSDQPHKGTIPPPPQGIAAGN